jgi:hypothetical protein
MTETAHLVSEDRRVEGVQVGAHAVLFGRDGDLDLGTPVTYRVAGKDVNRHLLVNLKPDHKYLVSIEGSRPVTVTATHQGVVAFNSPAGEARTVTVRTAP